MQTAALHHFCGLHAPSARSDSTISDGIFNSTAPSLRTIASILKNGLDKPDKAESQPAQPKTNSYGITRGAAYFRKGGDR